MKVGGQHSWSYPPPDRDKVHWRGTDWLLWSGYSWGSCHEANLPQQLLDLRPDTRLGAAPVGTSSRPTGSPRRGPEWRRTSQQMLTRRQSLSLGTFKVWTYTFGCRLDKLITHFNTLNMIWNTKYSCDTDKLVKKSIKVYSNMYFTQKWSETIIYKSYSKRSYD